MIASRFTNFATVVYYFIRILVTLQAIVHFTLELNVDTSTAHFIRIWMKLKSDYLFQI